MYLFKVIFTGSILPEWWLSIPGQVAQSGTEYSHFLGWCNELHCNYKECTFSSMFTMRWNFVLWLCGLTTWRNRECIARNFCWNRCS